MVQILAAFCGIVIAAMIPLNGELTAEYGTFIAAAIVHFVGTTLSAVLCIGQKERNSLWGHRPWWIYCGGAVGVLTTVFNALAYGKISMTSILALSLLGQTLASLTIDFTGLFGCKKQAFQKSFLLSVAFAGIGIFIMLDGSVRSATFAVLLAICAGVSAVISRMLNAALAEKISPLQGCFVNHAVGLGVTIVLAVCSILKSGLLTPTVGAQMPWIYCSGALGVVCVAINNVTVSKMSAFQLTIISFSSQILAGIAFDLVSGNGYSKATFYGGIIIAAGILFDTLLRQAGNIQAKRKQDYYAKIESVENEHRCYIAEKYGDRK